MNNKLRCRVKLGVKSSKPFIYQNNAEKYLDFSGYIGTCDKEEYEQSNLVHVKFDQVSINRLPKAWIDQRKPYDPYSYVFYPEELEILKDTEDI